VAVSNQWHMIIFISQDENINPVFIAEKKTWIFCFYFFRQDISENTKKICFTEVENKFYSENTENENTHFISSIFLNFSFIFNLVYNKQVYTYILYNYKEYSLNIYIVYKRMYTV
jgi:hypothetical protein